MKHPVLATAVTLSAIGGGYAMHEINQGDNERYQNTADELRACAVDVGAVGCAELIVEYVDFTEDIVLEGVSQDAINEAADQQEDRANNIVSDIAAPIGGAALGGLFGLIAGIATHAARARFGQS